MTRWGKLRRFVRALGGAWRYVCHEWTPEPPAAFLARVRWYRARPRAFTYGSAVALFELAEPPFRWRTHGRNVRERRRHLQKAVGDRYILRCLRDVEGIAGRKVRSNAGHWTLAEAMGEAFGEDSRTIERAWQGRGGLVVHD